MPIRTSTGFLPLVLAVGLAGCQSTSSPSPAPSAVQQPVPVPTPPSAFPPGVLSDYTLSGVVFEVTTTGQTPIEGAQVYCELCGAETHSWARTDSNGFYSFTGVWTTPDVRTPVWFRKEGYTDPPGVPPVFNESGWRQVLVTGDTRFDVELVRK
jgi:hypothetical protein